MLNKIFYSRIALLGLFFILCLFGKFKGNEIGIIFVLLGVVTVIYGWLRHEKNFYPRFGWVGLFEFFFFILVLSLLSLKGPAGLSFTLVVWSIGVLEISGVISAMFILFEKSWPR